MSPRREALHCLAVRSVDGRKLAWPANAPDLLSHGRFTQVAVYHPAHEVKQFVLLLSGPGTDRADPIDVALAVELAREGAMVARVTPQSSSQVSSATLRAAPLRWDLENLSRYVQAYYRLPSYINPILVGYSVGGTLAYAMIAQAPADLFAGAAFAQVLPRSAAQASALSGQRAEGDSARRWQGS